jgi:hypothetical protein
MPYAVQSPGFYGAQVLGRPNEGKKYDLNAGPKINCLPDETSHDWEREYWNGRGDNTYICRRCGCAGHVDSSD